MVAKQACPGWYSRQLLTALLSLWHVDDLSVPLDTLKWLHLNKEVRQSLWS